MAQQRQIEQAGHAVRRSAARAANQPWLKPLARLGYAAIGAVYILIGALAVRTALGLGGETTDQQGALRQILGAPFGRLLLGLIALGLFGYLGWRIVEAVLDVEDKGADAKGLVTRLGYFISGLLAGALGLQAARLALGSGEGANSSQDWTARLLGQPFGPLLVGLIGAIVIGVGGYQLYQVWKRTYRDKLAWDQMSAGEHNLADNMARVGLAAHGVVLALIGWFFIQAALTFNASQAGGVGEALAELSQQPYGLWLLGIVAAGLVAFGVYRFVEARYHHILAQ